MVPYVFHSIPSTWRFLNILGSWNYHCEGDAFTNIKYFHSSQCITHHCSSVSNLLSTWISTGFGEGTFSLLTAPTRTHAQHPPPRSPSLHHPDQMSRSAAVICRSVLQLVLHTACSIHLVHCSDVEIVTSARDIHCHVVHHAVACLQGVCRQSAKAKLKNRHFTGAKGAQNLFSSLLKTGSKCPVDKRSMKDVYYSQLKQ